MSTYKFEPQLHMAQVIGAYFWRCTYPIGYYRKAGETLMSVSNPWWVLERIIRRTQGEIVLGLGFHWDVIFLSDSELRIQVHQWGYTKVADFSAPGLQIAFIDPCTEDSTTGSHQMLWTSDSCTAPKTHWKSIHNKSRSIDDTHLSDRRHRHRHLLLTVYNWRQSLLTRWDKNEVNVTHCTGLRSRCSI